jgi:hypothetical protein
MRMTHFCNNLNQVYSISKHEVWFGLWCLTPLSTIFQLYRGGQFYWCRKPEYPEKTPTCLKSLTNFSHNVVSSTHQYERGSNSQLQ